MTDVLRTDINNAHDTETELTNDYDHNQTTDEIDSPYIDTGKTGGNIKFSSNNWLIYIVVALIILVIIYLIFNILGKIRIDGEDYEQRQTHTYFNNVHGEEFDEEAKQTIAHGERINNPRAIDHFRMGTVYLINGRDPNAAHRHFRQALDQIINNVVNARDVPFILERIDDLRGQFVDFPEIDDLPLQQAIHVYYNNVRNANHRIKKNKAEIAQDDPNYTQKVLLNKQDWQSDSQNVHDSAITTELVEQLVKIMEENKSIPNIHTKDYSDVVNWLRVRYEKDPTKLHKVQKVLSYINHNYPLPVEQGINEQDIIVCVWQRTFDPENKAKMNDIREALGDAVLDCYEGDTVVCLAGRTAKIWQALAKLDKNPDIGILRSKQMIRNEIFERSAKIVDDFVGESGTASESLKSDFQKGETTEQVREITECMKQQIDSLRNEYSGLLPPQQLDIIIEECKAAVE